MGTIDHSDLFGAAVSIRSSQAIRSACQSAAARLHSSVRRLWG
jgi:hypothetical protein